MRSVENLRHRGRHLPRHSDISTGIPEGFYKRSEHGVTIYEQYCKW
jgi:hypothetical protein